MKKQKLHQGPLGRHASFLAAIGTLLLASASQAQTITIEPQTVNLWVGTGNVTNLLPVVANVVTLGGGNSNANFTVTGAPAGSTAVVSPVLLTNSGTVNLTVGVTNNAFAAGFSELTINATGDAAGSAKVRLFAVPQWALTNANSKANWSAAGSWSGGVAPLETDGIYIEHTAKVSTTNVVDASRTNQSLVYLGDSDDNALTTALTTEIAPGATFTINGTNGLAMGTKANNSTRPWYVFQGNALSVDNNGANYVIANGASSSSTRDLRVIMTNLNNFSVNVNRFGAGDATIQREGLNGGAAVNMLLAKTNYIRTTFTDDYTQTNFGVACTYMNNGDERSGSFNGTMDLGFTNTFLVDSLGVGLAQAQGSGGGFFGTGGSMLRFLPALANNAAPTASAYFRGPGGGPMSLLAVGVDYGATTSAANTKGRIDLQGGNIDMVVDKIWIARNRANSSGRGNYGQLYFNHGTIVANQVKVGYLQYSNNCDVRGSLLVGTNGLLTVSDHLELGHISPGLDPSLLNANTGGKMRIELGGTVRAKEIRIGEQGVQNSIEINSGGTLQVTNKIAPTGNRLQTLTMNGGNLNLNINGAGPYVNVVDLISGASQPKINIASVTNLVTDPQVITLINYTGAGNLASIGLGTVPSGYSGFLENDGFGNITLSISTNIPKTIVWRGFENANWDTTSTNWIDVATSTVTNFNNGDFVVFDDSLSVVHTSVSVPGDIILGQSVLKKGLAMTNSTLNYTFSGAGIFKGSASVVKAGTASLTLNNNAEYSVLVEGGTLNANATVGAISASAGTTLNISSSAIVNGGVSSAGLVVNEGSVSGLNVLRSGCVLTNSGTMDGGLTIQTAVYAYNTSVGQLTSIGSPTVQTNSTLVNDGVIKGANLDVSGVLFDSGFGSIQLSVGTLTINNGGQFIPGGAGVGTTTVKETSPSDPIIAGAVKFLTGSTNVFKINVGAATYTKVLANAHVFGPNQGTKAFNGGTLQLTNVSGSPFAAGQSFKLFGSVTPPDGTIFNLGLNTTNSYPQIDPPTPGAGLAWDLSELIPGGLVKVIGVPTVGTNIVSSIVPIPGTNLIAFNLSWPSNYTGWHLETATAGLTNGLTGATNWVTLFDSYWTNEIVITNTTSGVDVRFYRLAYP